MYERFQCVYRKSKTADKLLKRRVITCSGSYSQLGKQCALQTPQVPLYLKYQVRLWQVSAIDLKTGHSLEIYIQFSWIPFLP